MAVKSVEAQLVLGGRDGGAAAAVNALVRSFEQAEKAGAGVSKSTAQVARTLLEVEKAQAAVNAVMGARNGATAATENLHRVTKAAGETQAALDKARVAAKAFDGQKAGKGTDLAKQMNEAIKAVTAAEKAQRSATREVAQATKAHEMQARALRDAERAAVAANVPLNALEQHQRSLAGLYDRTTEAMRRQVRVEGEAARAAQHHAREQAEAARHMRQHGLIGATAAAAAGAVGIHGVREAGREAWKAGAEVQANRANLAKAGIKFDERQHITDRSLELAATYKNVTQASVMELWKEMRSVMTDPHEVDHIIDPMVRAKSLLDAGDKTGTASHGLNLLVKGAEAIGAAKDPARFTKLLDSYVKAMQVMGSTVTPEGIYEMQKYSKTSGGRWSDRFIMTTAQSLGQELGGSTAGNSIDVATRQIVGGMQNLHSKAKEFARIGLIDKKNLDILKTGEVKGVKAGVKHAVKGDDLAASDLDLWVYNVLIPHLNNAKITSEKDQMAWVQKNFTGTGANVIAKLIQQRESFEAHGRMYGEATGLKGTDLNRSDPNAGLQGLSKSLETFLGVLSQPIMAGAAHGLDDIATAIGGWSVKLEAFNKAHPDIAKWEAPVALGAGAAGAGTMSMLAYKALSGGFGLKSSALALDHSALALEAAALKLGGAGGVPGVPGAAAGVPAFVGLGLGTAAIGLGAAGIVAGAATAAELPKIAAKEGPGAIDPATGEHLDTEIPQTTPWLRDWWVKKFGTAPAEAGKDAGEKASAGIKEGIKDKTPETVEQAQTLYDKIKDVFKNPIYIPMSFEGAGGGGGGGSLIQKASFGGGGGNGGLGGYSGGGGYAGSGSGGGSGVSRVVRGSGGGDGVATPGGGSGSDYLAVIGGKTYRSSYRAGGRERVASWLDFYQRPIDQGGLGMAPDKARAMVAMTQGESGINLNPGAVGAAGEFGTVQWLGKRRTALLALATKMGKHWTDVGVQQQHMRNEMLGLYGPRYSYRGVYDRIMRAPSGEAALAEGINNFESPKYKRKAYDFRLPYLNGLRRDAARGDSVPGEPRLVKGLDGKEGLDLGDGTMKMPDGSIRSITSGAGARSIPDAPKTGAGATGMGDHVEALGRHIDRLADAQMRVHASFEVNAGPGLTAKAKRLRSHSDGPLRGNVGVSMPGAEIA
ncbi:hypothetical protein MFUR16E_04740 [Methylobacterium fujisawaense]|uniref:phage tail tip lysozyme n=1 Tax=Methylobacterium fujisawaense TaxID=107400 RepID=UPI002F2F614C